MNDSIGKISARGTSKNPGDKSPVESPNRRLETPPKRVETS